MSRALAAYAYYMRCVSRNRVRRLFQRLRRPRYLIGLLLTVLYFWFFLFRHSRHWGPGEGGGASQFAGWIVAGFFFMQIVLNWLFGSFGKGVVFRESEVQQLFPAPLTRSQLLLFKWVQMQFPLLFSSAFLSLLVQRLAGLSYPYVLAGMYTFYNLLVAHTTFMTLTLKRWRERGGAAAAMAFLPGLLLLGGLVFCATMAWREVGEVARIGEILESRWLRGYFWPLLRLTAPVTAAGPGEFLASIPWPILLFFVQAWLVVRADFRFEDQAVAMAGKITAFKSEGLEAFRDKKKFVVSAKPLFALAPTGKPWRAFVWKNVTSLGRVRRSWVMAGVMLAFLGIVFTIMLSGHIAPDGASTAGLCLIVLLLYSALFLPAYIRVDLRLDIPHFDVLKAMPVRGRELILGEVLGSTVVMGALQTATAIVAACLITRGPGGETVSWSVKLPLLGAFVPAVFALDFALLTAENLIALYMPSFVRLGRGMKAGFEQFGQNLVGALIRVLGFLVFMIVPGTLSVVVFVAAGHLGAPEPLASLPASLVASSVLAAEALLLIRGAERRYERFDLSSESLTVDS